MRVLKHDQWVFEVQDIYYNGAFDVEFKMNDDVDSGVMTCSFDKSIGVEEAQERGKRIVREAFEKGFVDCSQEPWDMEDSGTRFG